MNKIISKIGVAFALVALLGSCSEENLMQDEEAYGRINFALNAGDARAIDTSYDENAFQVSVKQGNNTVVKPQPYSEMQDGVLVKVGSGYQAYAESCSETEAESANGGWGCIRYYGTSDLFSVTKDQAIRVVLPCAIANAAVSVQTDEEIASSAYQLTIQASDNTGRSLTFDSSTKENTAYFNVAGSRTIQYTLTIGEHTLSQSFTIQPRHSYTLDVHKQTNEEITVSIGVTVDDTVDEDITEGTYNPYDKQSLNITE